MRKNRFRACANQMVDDIRSWLEPEHSTLRSLHGVLVCYALLVTTQITPTWVPPNDAMKSHVTHIHNTRARGSERTLCLPCSRLNNCTLHTITSCRLHMKMSAFPCSACEDSLPDWSRPVSHSGDGWIAFEVAPTINCASPTDWPWHWTTLSYVLSPVEDSKYLEFLF